MKGKAPKSLPYFPCSLPTPTMELKTDLFLAPCSYDRQFCGIILVCKARVEREKERNLRLQEWEQEERILEMQLKIEEAKLKQAELNKGKEGEQREIGATNRTCQAKALKLPAFVEGKDNMDPYIIRFERHASSQGWDTQTWAINLTGKGLLVCYSLSEGKLKTALLRRYELTEEGLETNSDQVDPNKGKARHSMQLD